MSVHFVTFIQSAKSLKEIGVLYRMLTNTLMKETIHFSFEILVCLFDVIYRLSKWCLLYHFIYYILSYHGKYHQKISLHFVIVWKTDITIVMFPNLSNCKQTVIPLNIQQRFSSIDFRMKVFDTIHIVYEWIKVILRRTMCIPKW